MVAHAYDSSIWEAEAGRFLVPGLHRGTSLKQHEGKGWPHSLLLQLPLLGFFGGWL